MKITLKQISSLETGMHQGCIGYALAFDNRKNTYYKQFELKAFKFGYDLMQSNHYNKIWKSCPDHKHIESHLLETVYNDKSISPIDWKIEYNFLVDSFTIEQL